jgi:large subunit ribosomal protein L35
MKQNGSIEFAILTNTWASRNRVPANKPSNTNLKPMRRPKGIKTKKSVTKRFKITGTGKVLFRGAGKRHLLQGKNAKRRRSLKKAKVLGATDVYRIRQNLPFSH